MEVIQQISLRIGFCGKRGRCYNKDCDNKNICMIGHEVVTRRFDYYSNGYECEKREVHRQWE